jgi:hypothetical protein
VTPLSTSLIWLICRATAVCSSSNQQEPYVCMGWSLVPPGSQLSLNEQIGNIKKEKILLSNYNQMKLSKINSYVRLTDKGLKLYELVE